MALNIKNTDVEALAADIVQITGESKTEAIRRALEDRKATLIARSDRAQRYERFRQHLREEVWPKLPPDRKRMTKEEEEEILGLGPEGF